MNGIQKAIEILKNSIWISVAERLPENNDDVLVTIKDKDDGKLLLAITRYDDMYFGGRKLDYKEWVAPFRYFHQNYEVIAWKPLPEPYKKPEQ